MEIIIRNKNKKFKPSPEYIRMVQKMKQKQLEATNVLQKVLDDPDRDAGTDPELKAINREANDLVKEVIEMNKILGLR